MFNSLRQRAKRYLNARINQQDALNGWNDGPALNATFNKVYRVGAKVTSVSEHVTLFNLACLTKGNIVEVGSYICMSSVIMASGFAPESGRKLFAIDMFPRQQGYRTGNMDDRLFRKEGQFEVAQKLAADCGFQNEIILLRGKSSDFYDTLERFGATDLVFIDGDHSYEGCRNDALNFHRIVQPGGFLVFHDFLSTAKSNLGPRQAADEFLREHPEFTVVCVVGCMLVTRRKT